MILLGPEKGLFKNKKFMPIGRFFQKIIKFFKEVKLEVKKVSWPSKKEILKNTLIIIGVSLALSIFLGGLDFIFTDLRNCYILEIEPCYIGKFLRL